jgi:hypothetical protein
METQIPEGISVWDAKRLSHPFVAPAMRRVINELGELSAKVNNTQNFAIFYEDEFRHKISNTTSQLSRKCKILTTNYT